MRKYDGDYDKLYDRLIGDLKQQRTELDKKARYTHRLIKLWTVNDNPAYQQKIEKHLQGQIDRLKGYCEEMVQLNQDMAYLEGERKALKDQHLIQVTDESKKGVIVDGMALATSPASWGLSLAARMGKFKGEKAVFTTYAERSRADALIRDADNQIPVLKLFKKWDRANFPLRSQESILHEAHHRPSRSVWLSAGCWQHKSLRYGMGQCRYLVESE